MVRPKTFNVELCVENGTLPRAISVYAGQELAPRHPAAGVLVMFIEPARMRESVRRLNLIGQNNLHHRTISFNAEPAPTPYLGLVY